MHEPVMVAEVLEALNLRQGGLYVDGTLGSGGHAQAILSALNGRCRLLGFDRDAAAVARAGDRLKQWRECCHFEQRRFSELGVGVKNAGWGPADGVLLDLGVSSEQLETPGRGFSFKCEGPLDMRMDTLESCRTAGELLNTLSEKELARMFREYGEVPDAGRAARAVVRAREHGELRTTIDFAAAVSPQEGRGGRRLHPATLFFQAVRIRVNNEIEELSKGLEAGLQALAPGGRMVVLSYHSLEDRVVKHCFREHAGRRESLAQGGWRWVGREPAARLIGRRPLRPSAIEETNNPRARSAKLRVLERMTQ